MKYVNRYDSVADAVAAEGNFSPNITHVAGSTNPNQLIITALGDNKPIHFVDRGGGFIEGATEPCKIIYTAPSKLERDDKYAVGSTFCGATITNHDFSNGNGVIEFDDDITQIEEDAFNFSAASGLDVLTSIVLSDTVTSIGIGAFANCKKLISITVPDSVTSIGFSAFKNCSSLTELTLPESIESIGGQMCATDENLVVTCLPINVPEITAPYMDHPFLDIQKVLVPTASLDAYKTAWPSVADKIEAIA